MVCFEQEIRTQVRLNQGESESVMKHSPNTFSTLVQSALSSAIEECKAINPDSEPQCALRAEERCGLTGYGVDFTCRADICVNPTAPAMAARQAIERATEIHKGFQVFQQI